MKKHHYITLFCLIAVIIYSCISNNGNVPQVIVKEKDTTEVNNYQNQIDSLEIIINNNSELINSVMIINDSLKYRLFTKDDTINYYKERYVVDEIKLQRIKYYNSIAAKGNNIKYLRGWINRVLNE